MRASKATAPHMLTSTIKERCFMLNESRLSHHRRADNAADCIAKRIRMCARLNEKNFSTPDKLLFSHHVVLGHLKIRLLQQWALTLGTMPCHINDLVIISIPLDLSTVLAHVFCWSEWNECVKNSSIISFYSTHLGKRLLQLLPNLYINLVFNRSPIANEVVKLANRGTWHACVARDCEKLSFFSCSAAPRMHLCISVRESNFA